MLRKRQSAGDKITSGTCIVLLMTMAGCASNKKAADAVEAVKPVAVATATAISREVPADFEETGTFVADESSDIAPPVAGRVISTPVDVGAHVTQGQIICELDHRDAELKLQQARAQLQEANAGVRQAQSRIGWVSGEFDPTRVPEVAAALANYQSALAQAKLAEADSQRYANLVATGDVSRSAFEKAHTQEETAEAQANGAKQQY
jgi:multidrug resistance efflux pump